MNVENGINSYTVFGDTNELLGTADVTLPNLTYLSQEIQGAGISGTLESVFLGHVGVMNTTINFRTVSSSLIALAEPREHHLEVRNAQQYYDKAAGLYRVKAIKYVMLVVPKETNFGNAAPASTADASGTFTLNHYEVHENGTKTVEIDPANFVCFINGRDWLEEVRRALGK